MESRRLLFRCKEVVRTDHRSVAPVVSSADPSPLDHGNIGHAVVFGEIIGRSEAVPAAADDDRVISRLGLRLPPRGLPAALAVQTLAYQRQCGIASRHKDRKRVVLGKSVYVRLDLCGGRLIKKKKNITKI